MKPHKDELPAKEIAARMERGLKNLISMKPKPFTPAPKKKSAAGKQRKAKP